MVLIMSVEARPDLAAFEAATRLSPAELVTELREALSVKLVAIIAGTKETRAVHQWASGNREIRDTQVLDRLRLTYRVILTLRTHDSDATVQAWLQGLSPILDERSPARVLREGDIDIDGPKVLNAARAFAAVA